MSVHLLLGDDGGLLSTTLSDLVHRLVGEEDRSLMVDSFDSEDYPMSAVVDAAQTAPFLTDRRVVVARGMGRFGSDEMATLVRFLEDPLDTTDLVLVPGGKLVKAVVDAVKKAGGVVIDTAPPTGKKDRAAWVEQQFDEAGLNVDASGLFLVKDWLGEDAGRLRSLIEVLESTYGKSRTLKSADIAPFLDDAGSVPPWDLTDAIDRGDTAVALKMLHRMMHGGERHPLAILAVLHNHYARLVRLDGADAHDEATAAALLGLKPGFPVRKAMETSRRLGPGTAGRAITLLARADLDLRGMRDWSGELVLEVLVARLSRLGSGRDTAARGRR